eukprot:scaffold664_cov260-Pinguiococcus_pyrenoidosus.AAC.26
MKSALRMPAQSLVHRSLKKGLDGKASGEGFTEALCRSSRRMQELPLMHMRIRDLPPFFEGGGHWRCKTSTLRGFGIPSTVVVHVHSRLACAADGVTPAEFALLGASLAGTGGA